MYKLFSTIKPLLQQHSYFFILTFNTSFIPNAADHRCSMLPGGLYVDKPG
jgi:hypothetical protein